MKKQLLSEIQQLAQHLAGASEEVNTAQLKIAVGVLYEKLAVLEYLEHQLKDDDNASSKGAESFDSKSFREQQWFADPQPVPQPEHKEDLVEPVIEKIKDLVAQMPEQSQKVDQLLEEILPKKHYQKNDLEEFASNFQEMPVFERKQQDSASNRLQEKEPSKGVSPSSEKKKLINDLGMSEKPRSINDSVSNGVQIGLNDRLAYIKHLFDGSAEDYNRVLSQLSAFSSYEEAETFLKGKVKPAYNYWLQKEEYADRFMTAVEKRFQ
ncbi:hypothetical protein [Altibacter sp. HG106]|uniref:hypothetical protein n=1 Tax=Altibacter sp. HG106 TaxID=3023937 RepID=UPI00234FC0EE|nr:hypothetical protein [Altibacter sp. HG106]MDC7994931.1 hypothetical protein [Altibacter sp. HG106]